MADSLGRKVIKTFKSAQVDEKNRIDLHVIRWPNGRPVLENRCIYMAEDGDRFNKIIGLNSDDIAIIERNLDEIKELLNG